MRQTLVVVLGLLLSLAAGADPHLEPSKTWVFAVCCLEYRHSKDFAGFTKVNRRDLRLVSTMKEQGVPADQITLLKDKGATEANVLRAYQKMLARTRPGDTLLIYFTGHGAREDDTRDFYMALYDADDEDHWWGLDQLMKSTESGFQGANVILAVDCCYSGNVRRTVKKDGWSHGYAGLGSSTSSAESTGNWTFTDALIDALNGDPAVDLDRNGTITLSEAGRYAAAEMKFAEGQTAGLSLNARFPPGFALRSVSRPLRNGEGELVTVRSDGDWFKGRVLERSSDGVLVHWLGLEDDYPDELVKPSQIKK